MVSAERAFSALGAMLTLVLGLCRLKAENIREVACGVKFGLVSTAERRDKKRLRVI